MNKSDVITKENTLKTRVLIFSFAMAFLSTTTKVVCLLGVLQPQKWMLATNIARWVWVAFYVLPIIVFLPGLLFSRLTTSSKLHTLLIGKYFMLVIAALLVGRLDVALVLSYIQIAIESVRKLRSSSEGTDGKARQFQQLESGFALLTCAVFVSALSLHSLPLAVALLVAEFVRFSVGIPQARHMLQNQSLNQK